MFRERSHRRRRSASGAVAVEFLAAAPIFMLIVFGIVEIGRAVMVHQLLTNAAREGARYAIVPGRTDALVNSKVEDYLQGVFPEKTAAEITADFSWGITPSLSTAASGAELTVFAEVDYSDISWGVHIFMPSDTTMRSEVKMRKE